MDREKKISINKFHKIVLILGSIFILLSVFHTSIWFDESYSVKIAENSFVDIWKIGSHDVHPIFYYWILHIIYLIFGKNILAYRLFSALCMILVGVIGYTHIRKDFGERSGVYFSILSFFLPFSATYASEIRMYTLGFLIGTIFSIYAYRIYNNKEYNLKDFIIFGISSILLCYTHYYGLVFAGVLNFILLIYFIVKHNLKKKELITFIIIAAVQIILYLPWLMIFLGQLNSVSHGFWISLSFPTTLFEIVSTQFKGNLDLVFSFIISTIILIYLIYRLVVMIIEKRKISDDKKSNEFDYRPALFSFILYILIVLIVYLISIIMKPILLYRYLLIISSLLIFSIAYVLGKDESRIRVFIVISLVLIISGINMNSLIKENYDISNVEAKSYIENNIKDGDIVLYRNAINGAVITTELSMTKNNISYFYDKDHWNVDEAYKTFGDTLIIKQELKDILDSYKGKIYIVESGNSHELYDEVNDNYNITLIEKNDFYQKYKDYTYSIYLIEKNN